jgi:N-formylglutamate deformylase
MIFHIPHAATEIPAEYRASFLLTNEELQQEILRMTDHFTDELFGASVGEMIRQSYLLSVA